MSNNIGRTLVAAGQNQKEATINDSDSRIDAAITETLDSDYTSGNIVLTSSEFQQAVHFNTTNLTVARSLTIPDVKKQFIVDNTGGTAILSVVHGSTSIDLAVGDNDEFYTDGTTNSLIRLGSTPPATAAEVVSTDAGAAAGPDIKAFRDSPSPASADFIGRYLFDGRNSASTRVTYASLEAQIDDPLAASEDASLFLKVMVAGTPTTVLDLSGAVSTFSSIMATNDTTEATSTATGSGQFAGGIGVAKDVFVGGTVTVRSASSGSTADADAHLVTENTGINIIELLNPNATASIQALYFSDAVNGRGQVRYTHVSGRMELVTESVVALTLDLSQNAIFSGDVDPAVTETQDIGSTTLEWDNIFLQNAPTVSDIRRKNDHGSADFLVPLMKALDPRAFSRKSKVVKAAVPEQILQRQKVEISKELLEEITVVDGVAVLKKRMVDVKKLVFETMVVEDENGVPIKRKGEYLTYQDPVMEDYVVPAVPEVVVPHGRIHTGFMAQHLKALMDDLGIEDWAGYAHHNEKGEDVHVLRLLEFIAPMLAYTQELEGRIKILEAKP